MKPRRSHALRVPVSPDAIGPWLEKHGAAVSVAYCAGLFRVTVSCRQAIVCNEAGSCVEHWAREFVAYNKSLSAALAEATTNQLTVTCNTSGVDPGLCDCPIHKPKAWGCGAFDLVLREGERAPGDRLEYAGRFAAVGRPVLAWRILHGAPLYVSDVRILREAEARALISR
jgi:hypothetical protein